MNAERDLMGDGLLACPCIPPDHAEESDEGCNADCVIHVCSRNGSCRGEEQDDTDKAHPRDGDGIDRLAPAAHGIRSWMELDLAFVPSVRHNDGDVADVECGCSDVEDAQDSQGTADTDQIQAAAEDDDEPDGIDGRVGDIVYSCPETVLTSALRSPMTVGLQLTPRRGTQHHEQKPRPSSSWPAWRYNR